MSSITLGIECVFYCLGCETLLVIVSCILDFTYLVFPCTVKVTPPDIYEILCGSVVFLQTLFKCVVPDALEHITNAQCQSFMRCGYDIYMHYRGMVDLFIFFRDVLDGDTFDF